MLLDNWEEDQLSFSVCMEGIVANKTYDNRLRHADLCGESSADNLGSFDIYIKHEGSEL